MIGGGSSTPRFSRMNMVRGGAFGPEGGKRTADRNSNRDSEEGVVGDDPAWRRDVESVVAGELEPGFRHRRP